MVIKKSCERIGTYRAELQQFEQTWSQKASAELRLEDTKQKCRLAKAKYEKYRREKMPAISLKDRAQGMIALWKEQAEVLGPLLQRWPGKTGVVLASGVQVPAAPADPNAISPSLIEIPIGTFQVIGDFRSILTHIESWNKFNRLVRIDPVTLKGTSPRMAGEYVLTVYIFPEGEAGPAVGMAGSYGQGAYGAMPGMMPGMAPGMAPGPMGPPAMSPMSPPPP